ncbi:FxsB family cyclophane-forming radical SAM/SPASM peptide maturase [Nocardia rhamnosiphila]|uniref:FxsB family cyclophane-forming radical SAM/SPASM peptide maturase n=1 Tax=Nocardia rhamnosiphila TaxID=426716 RepID=UPI00068C8CAE|nr:FxsB family cyclophane-forming radical SAM/SPASM peptide maturase [Nocardia rhamnosiphila]
MTSSTESPQYSAAEEWPAGERNAREIREVQRQALPFTQFVMKIHSRCNLACDYCYMYEMSDQSWKSRPKIMADPIFDHACRMIRDHAARFALPVVSLVFHGGEPLLVGHATLDRFARRARDILEPTTRVRLGMQTNGVLIDTEFLDICARHDVEIGVSLDGDERGHDRHRKYRRGAGSYADVSAGLRLLTGPDYRRLYSGLLCTIDIDNDPLDTYEALLGFGPPALDLLLPHGNWSAPPPARTADRRLTPYADWLVAIFDRWYGAPVAETRIRLFDEIIELLIGGTGSSESVGLAPVQLAVVETDGSLEQVDALKSAFAGAARLEGGTGGNALDRAMGEPAVIARQIGIEALDSGCRACPVHRVCGAGHYAHRYRAGSGFRNPSVYCADLEKLIRHIESRLRADLQAAAGR